MEALLGIVVVLLIVVLGVGVGILIGQHRNRSTLGIKEHTKASLTGLADLAIDEGVERFDLWLKHRPTVKDIKKSVKK